MPTEKPGTVTIAAADLDLLARSLPRGASPLVPQASYDAAGNGRRLSRWSPGSTGPNAEILPALRRIRDRSRDSVRNDAWSAAAVRVWQSALIGPGWTCRPTTADTAQKARINEAWAAWSASSDADGVLDFVGQQQLVAAALVESGEVFVRLRARRMDDGLPVPLQLQLIEGDQCPTDYNVALSNGNRIRAGIEFDRIGRRVAYWMFKEHPGERHSGSINDAELVRIPAENVLHIFMPTRPGQLRGIGWLHNVLARLRAVCDFEDAVLVRQQLANLFTGYVTRPMPTGDGANIDPLTGKTVEMDGQGAPMVALEPGIMQELLPGESIEWSAPPDAGANHADYLRGQLQAIAAAVGVPYEILSGDVKDLSDRSIRILIGEFRRLVESRQWALIVPQFLQPVRKAWATAAALSGAIRAADLNAAANSAWQAPAWGLIHPTQDIAARKMAVEAGFRSRSSVIAELGDDPEQVDAERAADEHREAGLGLESPADKLVAAEVEKLEAEAEAARQRAEQAQREAEAAKAAAAEARATAERAKSEKATADATREHLVTEARNRAKVAALELEAAQVGLAELKSPPGTLAVIEGGRK